MVPVIIAIPSAGLPGNRFFRFRQLDAAGVPIGPDTSSVYPALAGYTGSVVDLPAGILTQTDVAVAFNAVASGIYASTTQVSEVCTITDDINAAGAFFPSSTSGGGALIGTQDILGGSNFAQPNSNVCSLTTPAFASTAYLWAIQFRIGATFLERLRPVVYLGGAINAPVGSTLLHDFGQMPVGTAPNEYVTLYADQLVVLPPSSLIQVAIIGAGVGTSTILNYQASAGAGNWNVSPGGIFQADVALGTDPTVAPPAVFPAGGSNVSPSFTFNCRLIYRLAPFFADGQLYTQYGVNVDASALAFTTSFSAQILQGGALPPQIEALGLDYVAIAASNDASFRLAAYQGGVVEFPNNVDLVYDCGRGPSGPGLPVAWYSVPVPGAVHAPVDRTLNLWTAAKDLAGGTVHFSNVAGPGPAGPETNPMQFPQNTPGQLPEYESFSSNPAINIDPAAPFEPTFVANTTIAPVDVLPGNVQGSRIGLRLRPVLLQAIP